MIDSDRIRSFAAKNYIQPALEHGDRLIAVPVNAVESQLKELGLPAGRTPMVCSALRGRKFQKDNGIVLDHWDGPPSGQSTTVIFYYRLADNSGGSGPGSMPGSPTMELLRTKFYQQMVIASNEPAPKGFFSTVQALAAKPITLEALIIKAHDATEFRTDKDPMFVAQVRVRDAFTRFGYLRLAGAKIADQESPKERAFRLTEKLRGLLKEEIAAHGGTEGFMRWVRSDEDEDAA
jgi:hypothetical protein